MKNSLTTELESLRSGVHLLTVVLLVVTIVSAVRLPFGEATTNLMLMSGFAVVYFGGWSYLDNWTTFPKFLWLCALTVLWFMDMLIVPAAMYLIFSLFFLYLRVFDDWRGVVFVIFSTAAAVGMQVPHGLTFGGVMGPAVSALVCTAIHFTSMKLARTNVALKQAQAQLAESEHHAGVIAERQRIAHEIHDTLAQGLSSIQMLLHAAEGDLNSAGSGAEADGAAIDKARGRMELARKTAADNLAEARAMIAALQPAALAQTSLVGAIERMVTDFAQTSGITMDVDVEGQARQLPMKQEAALLRVTQGAVGNVVKHSEATRARITVTYAPQEVRVDVVDNGRGFDVAAVESKPSGLGHIGLSAMRRRAAELGGEVIIESTPGSGSAVLVSMPLEAVG